MTTAPLSTKLAGSLAVATLLLGVPTESASTIVFSVIGSFIMLLLGLIGWFASNRFHEIIETQKDHGMSLQGHGSTLKLLEGRTESLEEWQRERKAAHEQAQKDMIERLRKELEERKQKIG